MIDLSLNLTKKLKVILFTHPVNNPREPDVLIRLQDLFIEVF